MNTFNAISSLTMVCNIQTNTLNITRIDPINSDSVLLYFTNLSTPPAGSTYEYSFDGISFSGFSPSQTESPLNISNLENQDYTFYIRVVGTETISNAMPINFVGLTPRSFTSDISYSYSSRGLPTPSVVFNSSNNYRSISATDYGNILIATSDGIYYSNNYGETFTKSTNTPLNCSSVSVNNNGYALCCTNTANPKLLYFSYNFGITWTNVTNTTIAYPTVAFVSQNGTSYIYNQFNSAANSASNLIYKSNDYFSTIDSSINGVTANNFRIRVLSFASNGNGVTTGNGMPGYYYNNFSKTTTAINTMGLTVNPYAVGISENGRYVSADTQFTNPSCNFYDFGTTQPYSSTPNFTIKHTYTGAGAFAHLAPIGNNGICYISLDNGNASNSPGPAFLYKYDFSGNIFTNINIPTMVGNYNSLINTSPSGNYAVVCSYSTHIYILAPNPQ